MVKDLVGIEALPNSTYCGLVKIVTPFENRGNDNVRAQFMMRNGNIVMHDEIPRDRVIKNLTDSRIIAPHPQIGIAIKDFEDLDNNPKNHEELPPAQELGKRCQFNKPKF